MKNALVVAAMVLSGALLAQSISEHNAGALISGPDRESAFTPTRQVAFEPSLIVGGEPSRTVAFDATEIVAQVGVGHSNAL